MAEGPKRAEATHRQRADLAAAGAVSGWPYDAEGNPMAIVVGTASDLFPTVQYGNVMVGPVSIMRPVPNGTPEEILEHGVMTQKIAESIVGSERRLIQWATNPELRVTNPSGAPMEGIPSAPPAPTPPPVPQAGPVVGQALPDPPAKQ